MKQLLLALLLLPYSCPAHADGASEGPLSLCGDNLQPSPELRAEGDRKFQKGFNLGVFKKWVKGDEQKELVALAALPLLLRTQAFALLTDKQRHHEYKSRLAPAFDQALGEWARDFAEALRSSPAAAKDYIDLLPMLKHQLEEITIAQEHLLVPAEDRLEHGDLDLPALEKLFPSLAPLAQSHLFLFARWREPFRTQWAAPAWIKAFRAADSEQRYLLTDFLEHANVTTPEIREALGAALDPPDIAFVTRVAHGLMRAAEYRDPLTFRAFKIGLESGRVHPSALGLPPLIIDYQYTSSLDPSRDPALSSFAGYVQAVPADFDQWLAPWLAKLEDQYELRGLIANLGLLRHWSASTERAVAKSLLAFQADARRAGPLLTVLKVLELREDLRDPEAKRLVRRALSQMPAAEQADRLTAPVLAVLRGRY